MSLDTDSAEKALLKMIGTELDVDAVAAADGVSRIVDESMASAARMHASENGKDLGDRTLIAFGGNGPLHATRVARSAGINRILVPPDPGVGSAIGFLYAPVSYEIVRSRYSLLDRLDYETINTLFDTMISEANSVVAQGADNAPTSVRRSAFMRYSGQGHEIEIDLPNRALAPNDITPLTEAFDREYTNQFSRPVPGMTIEVLNWAVRVATDEHAPQDAPETTAQKMINPEQTRPIVCDVDGQLKPAALV